jgi:hypothetical protein
MSNAKGHEMHLRAVLRQSAGTAEDLSYDAGESLDRRLSKRRSLTLTAQTSSGAAGELPVLIHDISQGGLLLEAATAELSVDDHIELELPESGLVTARVAWKSGRFFGCQFSQLVAPAAISAALLKAAPQSHQAPVARDQRAGSRSRLGIEPELNFAVAFLLALVLWGLIGLAILIAITYSS